MSAATGFESCLASWSASEWAGSRACPNASGDPRAAAASKVTKSRRSPTAGPARELEEHLGDHVADRRARILHDLVSQPRLCDALPDHLLPRKVHDVHV